MRAVCLAVLIAAVCSLGPVVQVSAQNCASCVGTEEAVLRIRYNIELQLRDPNVMYRRINYTVHANQGDVDHYRLCAQNCTAGLRRDIENNLDWIEWAIKKLPPQEPFRAP